jgi:hypothetical protein
MRSKAVVKKRSHGHFLFDGKLVTSVIILEMTKKLKARTPIKRGSLSLNDLTIIMATSPVARAKNSRSSINL